MRRIDLICKLVGPLAISSIAIASTDVAIYVTFGMSLASVVVEYVCIEQVCHHQFPFPALKPLTSPGLPSLSKPSTPKASPFARRNSLPWSPNRPRPPHPPHPLAPLLLPSLRLLALLLPSPPLPHRPFFLRPDDHLPPRHRLQHGPCRCRSHHQHGARALRHVGCAASDQARRRRPLRHLVFVVADGLAHRRPGLVLC